MMNKAEASTKYLSTLQRQLASNQESIQLNSKIGTFLINQGRIEEAIPYYVKIIELGSSDSETRKKLLAFIAEIQERKTTELIDGKYATVRRSSRMGEESQQQMSKLMETLGDASSRQSQMEQAVYRPEKTIYRSAESTGPNSRNKTVLVTRRMGERVAIEDDINITVLDVDNHTVRLQLEVPVEHKISHDQSYLQCCEANRSAMMTSKKSLASFRHRLAAKE